MNKDIQAFNTNDALKMDIDEYYQDLLDLYSRSYMAKDSNNPIFLENFGQYIQIINQELNAIPEANIMEQMLITKGFLECSRNVKIVTWKGSHTNKQLVIFQNIEDLGNDKKELVNYLGKKFKQLSIFLELYVHELLSEGQWELYASNGLQNS